MIDIYSRNSKVKLTNESLNLFEIDVGERKETSTSFTSFEKCKNEELGTGEETVNREETGNENLRNSNHRR